MPKPTWDDVLDDEMEVGGQEGSNLICKLSDARSDAAYWEGRCEGLELVIVQLKESHTREYERINREHALTVGYLKDRLNRYEVKPDPAS